VGRGAQQHAACGEGTCTGQIRPSANSTILPHLLVSGFIGVVAMYRLLFVATMAAKVGGLQMSDAPTERDMAMSMLGAGVVSTLDPVLTNAKGETFHVTQEGEHLMLGIPSFGQTFNKSDPGNQELVVKAQFSYWHTYTQNGYPKWSTYNQTCEDLLISAITFEGKRLPNGISKISFKAVPHYDISEDNFNYTDTSYIGFTVTTDTENNLSAMDFLSAVPECVITYKKPEAGKGFKLPTRRSFASRVTQFHGTCQFTKQHEINFFWGIVYKGWGDDARIHYANDIAFTMSGAGTAEDEHPGLLGTSNHTDESANYCSKNQPVGHHAYPMR